MNDRTLELIRELEGNVAPDQNVIFEKQLLYPAGIDYDNVTGTVTFNEVGEYSVQWWVATETTLRGAVAYALVSSQYSVIGSSPRKTGQVSGFGIIEVTTPGATMSLVNKAENGTTFSRTALVKASLLITPLESIGTIIPFSSGERPNLLETDDNGDRWLVAYVGFGNGTESSAPDDPIDPGFPPPFTFTMPTAGTISALSASFILDRLEPAIDNNITAQLYYSLTFDNTYTPVPGAIVELGTISGSAPYGTILNGIVKGINVPVPEQTKLVLIFYNTTNGQAGMVRGYLQGGLLIK